MDRFKKYLSEARIKTFEKLDSERPIELYFRNVALCESFYPSIHFLEIILRNRISKAVTKVTGSDWVELEQSDFFDGIELENLHNARNSLAKIQKDLSSDNMIAELNFGFWLSLFHKRYEAKIWQKKGTLQTVFSNHINTGLALNIKKIRADLENIRKLRNRIFHHEPVVNISLGVNVLHNLIYFYLESMAPEIVEEIKEVDNFAAI